MLYFCTLDTGAGNTEADWQGPYESISPRAAASLWIKREWDCRHRELIRVRVRDEDGLLCRVAMRVRVSLTVEREMS